MQLLPELARKIVTEVQMVMKEDIIVADTNSQIISSTDERRIGSFHEGAKTVIESRMKLYITSERARLLKGVKPGINMPILFEDQVIGVIGVTGNPEQVEPFAELIRRMTELIIRESYHLEKLEWEFRGLESFVYEWVNATEVNEELIKRGQILGVSIATPHLCILVHADGDLPEQFVFHKMNDWFKREFPDRENDHFIRYGQGRFLILKGVKRHVSKGYLLEKLTSWASYFSDHEQIQLSFGVAKTVSEMTVVESYQEAKKALQVACKRKTITFYEDLLLEIILEEVPEQVKQEFINRTFNKINDDDTLLQTLRVFFAQNSSIKETAALLHIHINTLHYRLKQVKEWTGVDPKETEGAVLLYLALALIGDLYK